MHARLRLLAATLALVLAAGCDDTPPGTVAPDSAFALELAALNLSPATVQVLYDVAVIPNAGGPPATLRVVGGSGPNAPAVGSVRCDAAQNPHTITVRVVGVYTEPPASIGAYGDPAPAGELDYQNPGELRREGLECMAAVVLTVPFDIALMRPAQQGFLDLAVNARCGAVRDAVWDVNVLDGATPAHDVSRRRVTSADIGDGTGSVSVVDPCSAADGEAADDVVEVRLVALYAAPVSGTLSYGDPPPPGGLEMWPLPLLTRRFVCRTNQDVFEQVEVTVAQVDRADEALHAAFGGLRCAGAWVCGHGPASPTRLLDFTCARPDDVAPKLYLDDLVLRCEGAEDLAIDPTVGAQIVDEALDGETRRTWRVVVAPDPDRVAAGACVLEARGTAEAVVDTTSRWVPPVMLVDGTVAAGVVYPVLTWSIPVSDAHGPVCADAALDLSGPITLTYTASEATADTVFAHTLP